MKPTYCSRERALREKVGPKIYAHADCPTCGRKRGQYCKYPSGLTANKLHESRLKLIEEAAAGNWNLLDVDDVVKVISSEYVDKIGTVLRAAGGDFLVDLGTGPGNIWFKADELKLIRKP